MAAPSLLAAHLAAAERDPAVVAAAAALQANRLAVAEGALRALLRSRPVHVAAIRMLAEVAGRLGRYGDAEKLLRRALDLAPDFVAARANLVTVLQRQSKFSAAHAEADRLLSDDPGNAGHLAVKAAVSARTGGYDEAIAAYVSILTRFPAQPQLWVSYGHVLKTVGRQAEAVAAYRRAIGDVPTMGDAWWSLANLKTVRLGDTDIAAMRDAVAIAPMVEDRFHLHFALGKALEDARDYAASFEHYAAGNRLRRAGLPYDPEQTAAHVARTRALMTATALDAPGGIPPPTPSSLLACHVPGRR